MKPWGCALLVVLITTNARPNRASELEPASLAGLSSIGQIIVTAANDTVAEDDLRHTVARRLARAGIVVDGSSGSELIVDVAAERLRAESGNCEFGTFRVSLALREMVTVERIPARLFAATTWRTSSAIRRFSMVAPRRAIVDVLEEEISSFLAAVARDTQAERE
jgi:hypothetical protein